MERVYIRCSFALIIGSAYCRLGSGKQVNAVIVDNGKDQDDEDDLFVVEDNTGSDPYLDEVFRHLHSFKSLITHHCLASVTSHSRILPN